MNIGKGATVREQLYGGFSISQGRIYGDMLCMCIDIGYGGTGEIRERSKDVLIGQLFVETALVTVKQKSDLLCHSQLDGLKGCVAIIC